MIDLDRARQLMAEKTIDVLVASSPENFHYISGFKSPYLGNIRGMGRICFAILPREKDLEPAMITVEREGGAQIDKSTWIKDKRYFYSGSHIEKASEVREHKLEASPYDALLTVLKERGLQRKTIGIEHNTLLHSQFERLQKLLPEASLEDCSEVLRELRSIKSEEEIDRIRQVTKITELGLKAALDKVRQGVSEFELKQEFEAAAIRAGGDMYYPAHCIISGGINTATGTYNPSPIRPYLLKKGDLVVMDLGALYLGYTSDVTRMAKVGEPAESDKKLYRTLLQAQQKVIENARPGVRPSDLFAMCIDSVREAGYPEYARAGVGHGIGLLVHEYPPLIGPEDHKPLRPGMVFAVEVPYSTAGYGGFSVEDVVLVTRDGHEVLSTSSRELTLAK